MASLHVSFAPEADTISSVRTSSIPSTLVRGPGDVLRVFPSVVVLQPAKDDPERVFGVGWFVGENVRQR